MYFPPLLSHPHRCHLGRGQPEETRCVSDGDGTKRLVLAVRVAEKIRGTGWSCFHGRISTPSPNVLGCRAAAAAVQKTRNAVANVNTPRRGKRRKRVKSPLTQCLPASERASERRHTHDGQCVPRIYKAAADMLANAINTTKPPSQTPHAVGC